jgi:hypothetical protein
MDISLALGAPTDIYSLQDFGLQCAIEALYGREAAAAAPVRPIFWPNIGVELCGFSRDEMAGFENAISESLWSASDHSADKSDGLLGGSSFWATRCRG